MEEYAWFSIPAPVPEIAISNCFHFASLTIWTATDHPLVVSGSNQNLFQTLKVFRSFSKNFDIFLKQINNLTNYNALFCSVHLL